MMLRQSLSVFSGLMLALTLAGLGTASATNPVKVGLALDLTGPMGASGSGAPIKEGFELAIEMLGRKLGGFPAEFIQADSGGNPEQARQVVDRMIQRDKIDIFTGPIASNVALAIGPTLFAAKIPYLSPNTGPRVWAGAQCNPYFFGVAWQNDGVPAAAGKLASDKGYKRTVVMSMNYPGGRETAEAFKAQFTGTIVEEIYVKLGQAEFGAEIAQIRAAKADSVFFFTGPQFLKQFESAGLLKSVDLIVTGFSADQENIDAIGASMIGLYNASHWAHDLPNPANQKFVAAYRAKYGRYPSMFAAQAYDVIMSMDAAVRDVGGNVKDRAALAAAFRKADFQSVRGSFKYGNNHFPIQDYYVRIVEKNSAGVITNRLVSQTPILAAYQDPYAKDCPLK